MRRVTEPDEPEALPGLRETVRATRAGHGERKAAKAAAAEPAAVDPVARVLVDVPLAHLDRTFDYLVPAAMADQAVPGARVKVRFAGQEVGGYLLERGAASDHPGRLTPLRRVVSAEPVLSPAGRRPRRRRWRAATPAPAATCSAWPCRPGTRPPSAPNRSRRRSRRRTTPPRPPRPGPSTRTAEAFLRRLAAGESPRAVWATPPGADWPLLLAHAGRGDVRRLRSRRPAVRARRQGRRPRRRAP